MNGKTLRLDESKPGLVKLDKKDRILLSCLCSNSRMPINEMARKILLSKDAVIYRIKRLISERIILGFYPNIDFSKFGMQIFSVLFILDESNRKKQQEFIEKIIINPNVTQVIEYSDSWDIEVKIAACGLEEFDNIIEDMISGYDEIIQLKDTFAKIYSIADEIPPKEFRDPIQKAQKKAKAEIAYDNKDIKILKALCEDARASNYTIAEKAGVSADTARLRIRAMAECGIIKEFSTKLNLTALGYHWHSFVCEVSMFDRKLRKKAEQFISGDNAITSGKRLLGRWDLKFDLMIKDQIEFHRTIELIKEQFSDVIRRYEAWFVYKEHLFVPMPTAINASK